jgi:chromosomal replication initiation ATPase DnaA
MSTALEDALARVPEEHFRKEARRRARAAKEKLAGRILAAAAAAWEGDESEIRHYICREPYILHPRQAAMVIMRRQGMSGSSIARFFGMDHGSVIHAVKTHHTRMADEIFARRFRSAEGNAKGLATQEGANSTRTD